MNCKEFEGLIMEHFDGSLNDIENMKLKQHLKTCKDCRESYDTLNEIMGSLGDESNMIAPPEDFEIHVMERINDIGRNQSKRLDLLLITIYAVMTFAVIGLVTVILDSSKEFFSTNLSFLETMFSALIETLRPVYIFTRGIITAFIQVSIIVSKAYYNVLITLLGMALIIRKMLTNFVTQGNGGSK